MFRPVSACAHVRAMQSMRVFDVDVSAEGRRSHVLLQLRSHSL